MKLSWLVCILVFGVPPTFVGTQAHAGLERDTWYEVTLHGVRVGYAHEEVRTDAEGLVETSLESTLTVKRMGESAAVGAVEVWRETVDGSPVSYRSSTKTAGERVEIEAVVDGLVLRVRRSSSGEDTHGELAIGEDLVFPHGERRLHASCGFMPGDSYRYTTYAPDFDSIGLCEVTVEGREKLDILGETVELNKLVLKIDLYEGVGTYEWRDDEGHLWVQEIPAFGLTQTVCAREAALAETEAAEIVLPAMVPSNVELAVPAYDVDSAVYEIWIEGGDISAWVPEDRRQKVVGVTERGVVLSVDRVMPIESAVASFPMGGRDVEPYLEDNPLMQLSNQALVDEASRTVSGAGDDPWLAAGRIEERVYHRIDEKGLGTALAGAMEVLEKREGDCSEHAVLMIALCRAVGIPARAAAGVVYLRGSFAYHMWGEVWTGGGWYALDPTIGRGSVDATHIKLAESSLPGGSTGEISVPVMRVLGRLGVRFLEYSAGGTTKRVERER